MDEKKLSVHEETAKSSTEDKGHLANAEDHNLTKWQAIKKYPKTCVWCIYAVWVVLLVSFENQASGTVLGIPEFRKDFGDLVDGQAIFGTLIGAQIADWYGRKPAIAMCIALSFVAITLEFVAVNIHVFFGGKLINGFATGALASLCTTYVSEIAPLPLRGILTCLIPLSYTLGPFTVALIVNSTGNQSTRWAYRSVFCAQYGFAAVAALCWFMMPESPWWLCSKDRDEKATRSLQKLGYKYDEVDKHLSVIKLTLQEIREETDGVTYLECFRASNLRRTFISLMPLAIQAMSGIVFAASYSTYYMQLSGFSTDASFRLQIVQQILSMIGNACSWYLTDKVGRRSLTLGGVIALTIVLCTMGGLAVVGSAGALKGAVAMILLYCFIYNVTIGATAWNIVAEVSTSRLRVKTISIGIAFQYSLFVFWSFVLPIIFNPDQANLGGKTGFIFGGLSFLCIAYLWFYQPETAGRSYEEIDELFTKRIPARKFKGYKTDVEMKQDNARRASMGEM